MTADIGHKIRPNLRVSWQTCRHCLDMWWGHDESPCPSCAAMAGSPTPWRQVPWGARCLAYGLALLVVVFVVRVLFDLLQLWGLR